MSGRQAGTQGQFRSPYTHGFFRVAACTPSVGIADPAANAAATLDLARQADRVHAGLAVFPELGLSAYAIDDLLFQDAMLEAVEDAICSLAEASRELQPILVVGAPLRVAGMLFNCGIALHRGRVLCAVPKIYLPNYREFYEKRHFASGMNAPAKTIRLRGHEIPFGPDIIVEATDLPGFALHIEVCEDLWVPAPPSTLGALAGATILANLSASNITVGKGEFRRLLAASQSGRCIAGYVYSGAGFGESTTDLAWDGHAMIHENGDLLAESTRFATTGSLTHADIDLDRLRQDRMRMTSFGDSVRYHHDQLASWRRVPVDLKLPREIFPLRRELGRFPFVPDNEATLHARCAEIYEIQVQGLMKRLVSTAIDKVVIGISGGLDSTQAAIVAAKAFDRIGLPRKNILGYSMPGFATTSHTRNNANGLMAALGFTAQEIDIRPSAKQMILDIGHPYGRGEEVYDITFENIQAGERTSHLFRLANLHKAIVVGTGDLSEIALGFATYGVGDHMSHYAVNASVPKSLIRHLMRWEIEHGGLSADVCAILKSIVATKISPELIPGTGDTPSQSAEQTVGPYALQDFFLYYISRFGYRPSKVAFLAEQAWSDATRGRWPSTVPAEERVAYDLAEIKNWLEVFLIRFFKTSQFKRSALPNGPKVGSGGSLSPRSDWRAPSDGNAEAWLSELAANVP